MLLVISCDKDGLLCSEFLKKGFGKNFLWGTSVNMQLHVRMYLRPDSDAEIFTTQIYF